MLVKRVTAASRIQLLFDACQNLKFSLSMLCPIIQECRQLTQASRLEHAEFSLSGPKFCAQHVLPDQPILADDADSFGPLVTTLQMHRSLAHCHDCITKTLIFGT
eukprot:6213082-Pleurochrysis_carterae.AAC.1